MVLTKRLPLVSLALLLVAYATLGYFLSKASVPTIAWSVAIAWVILLATFFISPLQNARNLLNRWLQSDTVAFIVLIILAALASFVLLWWPVFLQVLAVISTEALVRLDIQTARFTDPQVFVLLVLTSLAGLGLGWTVHVQIWLAIA